MNTSDDPRREALGIAGRRYLIRDHVVVVVHLALLLGSARALGWNNAWLLAGLVLAIKVSSAVFTLRLNPAVLNARGTRREMSRGERIFFAVLIPASLAMPIVAGVDVGGRGWSHQAALELGIGIAMMVVGGAIDIWALAVNAFFEPTVRIQRDRGQRVCSSGPYRLVRHPGYLGAILIMLGAPLVLGSRWCFVPAVVQVIALAVRTIHEDRLLHAELEGYGAYAESTRYRLVPSVW